MSTKTNKHKGKAKAGKKKVEKCEIHEDQKRDEISEGEKKTGIEISEEETKEIKEAFDILDGDGDGKLSLVEMKKLLQSQFMVFTDAEVEKMVQQLDSDNSGSIEYDEFEKFILDNNLSKPTAEEFGSEMLEAFKMFDTDGDGVIDAEEFKTLMMRLGEKLSHEEALEMMKEADLNKDGKIDYQEFCAHMSKNL